MIPWTCRIGWHMWSKWSEPVKTQFSIYQRQTRTCRGCDRAQERAI